MRGFNDLKKGQFIVTGITIMRPDSADVLIEWTDRTVVLDLSGGSILGYRDSAKTDHVAAEEKKLEHEGEEQLSSTTTREGNKETSTTTKRSVKVKSTGLIGGMKANDGATYTLYTTHSKIVALAKNDTLLYVVSN